MYKEKEFFTTWQYYFTVFPLKRCFKILTARLSAT